MGGKSQIAYKISRYLKSIRKPGQTYWEPFVGGGWVLSLVEGSPNYASDKNYALIEMWKALVNGWEPPDNISEEQYAEAKLGLYEPHLTAFIAYSCSFGGAWFNGYARSKEDLKRNYCKQNKIKLLEKIKLIKENKITFFHGDFLEIDPPGKNCLIYCDPPYGNHQYLEVGVFEPSLFWDKVRGLENNGHTVIVSEYEAPPDFSIVSCMETRTRLLTKGHIKEKREEKLFRFGIYPSINSIKNISLF